MVKYVICPRCWKNYPIDRKECPHCMIEREKREKKYTFDNLVDVLSNTFVTTKEEQELKRIGFKIG